MDTQAHLEVELYNSQDRHKVIQTLEQDIAEAIQDGNQVHLDTEA